MTYAKQAWVDGLDSNTPVTAARLNHMEDGIAAAMGQSGVDSPEGAVSAPVGSLYLRSDGGPGSTMYVKESGSGNTGWVAK